MVTEAFAHDQELLVRLHQLGTECALDLETAPFPVCWEGRHQQRLIQFHNDRVSMWFDLKTWGDEQWNALAVFLANPELEVYGHNLAFDVKCLMASGVEVKGRLFDSMIASRMLHAGESQVKHSLAEVARRTLGRIVDKTLQAQDWMNATLDEASIAYAMGDVDATWAACHVLHEQIHAQGLEDAYALECALIPVIASMELAGLYVDVQALEAAHDFYKCGAYEGQQFYVQLLDELLRKAGHEGLPRHEDGSINTNPKTCGSVRLGTKVYAGFNISAVQQNANYWGVLGIAPVNDQGKVSLDKKNLATYRHHEIVRAYETFKKADKRSTMAKKLIENVQPDGRIRAQFMPLQTATSRFSCANPNLTQVPRDKEFRCAFIPAPGMAMIQADYSAMELRFLAFVAKCAPMLDAFNTGVDLHTRTAALMYGVADADVVKDMRTAAKACNFGLAYASAAKGLQQYFATLGLYITLKEAQGFHKMWHEAYPEVGVWHRWCQQQVDRGNPVRTAIGWRRKLYGEENRVQIYSNNVVQGSCAGIMKCAMVSIHRALPAGARIVAVVHDELLCECRIEDAEEVLGIVVGEMEEAARPMVGDAICMKAEGGIVLSWGDK